MAVSIYKIKKWVKMLAGKSEHHVNQDIGKIYSCNEVSGYYNDLTEKITRFGLTGDLVPQSFVDTGKKVFFSIEIFQYGLGAYDLYLLNHDENMLLKAIACANWAVENQKEDGSWVTFDYQNADEPFSAMAQGEGVSLLIRVYKETHDERYLTAIQNAMEFLVKPIGQGGVTEYSEDDVVLKEYTFLPTVLNGWIFSLWGVWDYIVYFKDGKYDEFYMKTIHTLERCLPSFDTGYWSYYTDGGHLASPFYHSLHIAQLEVMYQLTKRTIFQDYRSKWEGYKNSKLNRNRAFVMKAIQKIVE